MKTSIQNPKVKVGDTIRILYINDNTTMFKSGKDHQAKAMENMVGKVTKIDSTGALFGTWGGLSVLPDADKYELVEKEYHVAVTFPLTLYLGVKANSEEEAKKIARKKALNTPYKDWGDDFSRAEFDIVDEVDE